MTNDNADNGGKTIKPFSNKAKAFLKQFKPEGPWVLTAIQVDKKGIETKTFYPGIEDKLDAWLELHNGERNIYFHVNTPIHDLDKKANREDIKSVDWFHVDIDPEAGEDLEKERERCLDLLTDKLPQGVPEPTCIILSGGGYQGFWKLKTPLKINGDLGLAEEAKRYNQQLELLFGADNCHNVDRIMRLPGTVNIPDARKRKKGRKRELAKVIEFEPYSYDIDDFTKAATVQIKGEKGFSGTDTSVNITGNIEKITDLEELNEWNVPDRIKVIIAQGRDPDNPKDGDNSRSAWLFDCVCSLVRSEVPDDVIYSILTDPEWTISESVLEYKQNAEKYAIRQIERAKEWTIDPKLMELNKNFAVIGNIGGKCRIIEEIVDPVLNRPRLTKQSFADFHNRFGNQYIIVGEESDGNPKYTAAGQWWTKHPKRRQYNNIVFAPGTDNVGNAYNLWRGFGCESRPGDCSLFLDHVQHNICAGNPELFAYVIGWMARCVQEPASQSEVSIVLRGGRGVGKSFFAKEFGKLFGRHFLQVSNGAHLVGNFNAHLRDVIVLFADEAFYAGDKKHTSVLKTLITEDTIAVEAKGVDVETSPNYVHLIMASNDEHVIPAGSDERRFLVLDVADNNKQDTNYFKNIANQLANGGREAFLHQLLQHDISDYDVRTVPQTEALHNQKIESMPPEEEWIYTLLQNAVLPNQTSKGDHTAFSNGNEYSLGLYDHARQSVPKLRNASERVLAAILKKWGCKNWHSGTQRGWAFPPLKEMRTAFVNKYGETEWAHPEAQKWGDNTVMKENTDKDEIPF